MRYNRISQNDLLWLVYIILSENRSKSLSKRFSVSRKCKTSNSTLILCKIAAFAWLKIACHGPSFRYNLRLGSPLVNFIHSLLRVALINNFLHVCAAAGRFWPQCWFWNQLIGQWLRILLAVGISGNGRRHVFLPRTPLLECHKILMLYADTNVSRSAKSLNLLIAPIVHEMFIGYFINVFSPCKRFNYMYTKNFAVGSSFNRIILNENVWFFWKSIDSCFEANN